MDTSFIKDPRFAKIITAYRKSLVERYSPANISRFPEFTGMKRETIDLLIQYFLELLYPEYEVRKELDNAFQALAAFTHSPTKLFGVMGNIAGAVFKFGKLLIPAMQAGINSLRSYVAANNFEKDLFMHAIPLIDKGTDISEEKVFMALVANIPQVEADKFRYQIVKLFEILSQKQLPEKALEVMQSVKHKMETKKNLYTDQEIEGIQMGCNIIEKGKFIFTELTDPEIALVLKGIDRIEEDFYQRCLVSVKI